MRIRRTLSPAASPIGVRDIVAGLRALPAGRRELDWFKKELCEQFKVKHCFLVSSGKTALTLILQALKDIYPDRDEVLIPAYTCYSVPSAVVRAGLKVELCDISADSFSFDPGELDRIISIRTDSNEGLRRDARPAACSNRQAAVRAESAGVLGLPLEPFLAIVPTHLFGLPTEMNQLRQLALRRGVPIVDDAAQAMGEERNGKKLGTCGDAGFFSLGRGKAFSTLEGGVILTNRDDLAERLSERVASLRDYTIREMVALICSALSIVFLQRPSFFWLPRSLPFLRLGETIYDPGFSMRKMSPFQAGLAKDWRRKLQNFRAIRRRNVAWCKSVLSSMRLRHYCEENGVGRALLRFPVRIDDVATRDALLARGRMLGIMPAYPDSIDGIEGLHGLSGRVFDHAKKTARTLVTIPVHPLVSKRDKRRMVELMKELLEQSTDK